MHADVAQRGGAQNGVGDGVGQHVGVGVAFKPEFAGHRHAAEDERPAGNQAVHIPAQPGAHFAQDTASLAISVW